MGATLQSVLLRLVDLLAVLEEIGRRFRVTPGLGRAGSPALDETGQCSPEGFGHNAPGGWPR